MKLILTEEEQFLKDTAKNFAEERCPISHFRSLRDNNDPILWDKEIWKEMTTLGWPGILIPEEYGGSNFGITGISVILGECAKTLTPSPLFATGVLGAFSITNFGSSEQKQNSYGLGGCVCVCVCVCVCQPCDPGWRTRWHTNAVGPTPYTP